jgi:hypothetical protein
MIKSIIEKHGLLITVIIQIILLLIGFNKAFSNSADYMFLNVFDGFRNYYAFEVYINQSSDWLKFNALNYPYGDYALFTDNSPVISMSLKFISTYIIDLSDHIIPIYNYIIIFGYLLTAVFSFLILKPHLKNRWLVIVLSIALAWLHPQVLRPFVGHINLAWAWLLLFTMYATQKITFSSNKKTINRWLLGLSLMLFLGGFVHLYYLLINVIFIGLWALAWSVDRYLNDENWKKSLIYGIIPTVSTLLITFLIIRLIDEEYVHRLPAKGYGYKEWQLYIPALFQSYDHTTISFPIKPIKAINYETYAYLGGFSAFALLGLLILRIVKKTEVIKPFLTVFKIPQNRILYYWGFAALFMSIMALGEEIQADKFLITNYLNPFFYLSRVTDQVTHFRCIARLSWFLFWFVNFGIAILVDEIFTQRSNRYLTAMAIVLLLILIVDTKDSVTHLNSLKKTNEVSNTDNYTAVKDISDSIMSEKYQAILPIPYYHQGTEDHNFTIDAPMYWLNRTCQLQRMTKLPLMASQMGRTPHYHAKELFTIFTEDRPSANLLERMNDKPVLIFYSKYFVDENPDWCRNKGEPAHTVAVNSKDIIEKYKMTLIMETGQYKIYEWDLQALK